MAKEVEQCAGFREREQKGVEQLAAKNSKKC